MLEYAIKAILKEVVGQIPVTPVFGTDIPCITYTDTPQGGTVVKQDQVEIKIIHPDYDEALELRESILKKMNIEQNKPSLVYEDVTLRPELSGGGSIFSDGPQVWELSIIFIIKWRCL